MTKKPKALDPLQEEIKALTLKKDIEDMKLMKEKIPQGYEEAPLVMTCFVPGNHMIPPSHAVRVRCYEDKADYEYLMLRKKKTPMPELKPGMALKIEGQMGFVFVVSAPSDFTEDNSLVECFYEMDNYDLTAANYIKGSILEIFQADLSGIPVSIWKKNS